MIDGRGGIRLGVVAAGVADLKKSPDIHAETVSQAILNTQLSILEQGNDYLRVALPDGYRGWMRKERIVFIDSPADLSSSDHKVASDFAVCRAEPEGEADILLRIPFGACLSVHAVKGTFAQLKLPSGQTGYLPTSDLVRMDDIPRLTPDAAGPLRRQARSFVGVPYLWGGVTPFGFDCSGLVQTVFGFFGVSLPRDTHEQISCGSEVELQDAVPGDLLFFPRHVAIYLGGGGFVHANATAGSVSVNSLDETSPDFREDLKKSLASVRRVI